MILYYIRKIHLTKITVETLKLIPMKKSSTIFLQVVIMLIGIGALALMLWEPQIEGRNAHATHAYRSG